MTVVIFNMSESRTSKSIKNAKVALFYYVVMLILSFWTRKVFFDYLGSEVIGLDTTAHNLLGFLNIAELGVGTSVTFFLYKHLFNRDYDEINRIVALQGWIYKRVAIIVIVGAGILMLFFPMIFKDIKIPLWYTYATFSIMLFGSMLGYFLNYRSIVLTTDQKGYKLTRVTQGVQVGVNIILLFLLPVVSHPFLLYLFSKLFSSLFSCWWLNHVLSRDYPWLKSPGIDGKQLVKEYPDVIKKTKQVFIHKITNQIISNTSPFLMYAYSTLTIVSYYSNYLLILGKVRIIIEMVFSSVGAAIGNLIASGDRKKIIRVFWELYDSRFCIASIVLLCLYFLSHKFIALWLGDKYVLSQTLLILLVISQSFSITRLTVDHHINGYGLFSDVWAPGVEGFINVAGGLIFGHYWGYQGVLMGGVISQLLIIMIWKPIFLFRKGFHMPVKTYFIPVILRYLMIYADVFVLTFLFNRILPSHITSYISFGFYSIVVFTIVSTLICAEFYIISQGFRDFIFRIRNTFSHKK